jgi:beta-xylosidase
MAHLGFDPYAFIDDDGQAYLYFGNGMPCQVYKLNEDMISLDGDPMDIELRGFREGIVVFKRNGEYYFMWSIDDARSPVSHAVFKILCQALASESSGGNGNEKGVRYHCG